MLKNEHQESTDAARHRQRNEPSEDDGSKQRPVDLAAFGLVGVHPAGKHHTANDTVCARNRDAQLAGDENRRRRACFDGEAAATRTH